MQTKEPAPMVEYSLEKLKRYGLYLGPQYVSPSDDFIPECWQPPPLTIEELPDTPPVIPKASYTFILASTAVHLVREGAAQLFNPSG